MSNSDPYLMNKLYADLKQPAPRPLPVTVDLGNGVVVEVRTVGTPKPQLDRHQQTVRALQDATAPLRKGETGVSPSMPVIESHTQLRGLHLVGRRDYSEQPPKTLLVNLRGRSFSHIAFDNAGFTLVDFTGSRFNNCTFYGASFTDCKFDQTRFSNSMLHGSAFRNNTYVGMDMSDIELIPSEGAFTAYKKVNVFNAKNQIVGYAIATLLVPEKAKRLTPLGHRKCRVSEALVVDFEHIGRDGKPGAIIDCTTGKPIKVKGLTYHAMHRSAFLYKKGKVVTPDKYDPNIEQDCSNGIHVFATRREAMNWGS